MKLVDRSQVPSAVSPPPSAEGAADRQFVCAVVPVVERPSDLSDLYREYSAPLRQMGGGFEFIFVLEPWAARLDEPLLQLAENGEPIRVLKASRVLGESGQLKLAESACRGDLVLTLPAYHRVEARCLPSLIRRVDDSTDLAVAIRSPRSDSWLNRAQNRIFHLLVGAATRERFRDIACGVRAMRRAVLKEVPLYGDFSRFLPLLAVQEGFRVVEVPCPQHPMDRPARVYSLGTYVRRALDLFGVFFLLRFTHKPLRFFGLLGGGLSLTGAAILVVVLAQRFLGQGLANRPLLLLGVLLLTLGVQVVALGLVGELIVHLHAAARPSYRIRERV